jgi:nicotinamide riboside kinase
MTTKVSAMSGAHATGKSATLDIIKGVRVPQIIVDDFKVSRTVLAKLGKTLEEATSTRHSIEKYQNAVLTEKIFHDQFDLHNSVHSSANTNFLVDRSPADIYAYAKLWSSKYTMSKSWMTNFMCKCVSLLSAYDKIFLFPVGVFPFVDDGIRAKEDTQKQIAEDIEDFLQKFYPTYHVIKATDVVGRANEIIRIIQNDNNTTTTS